MILGKHTRKPTNFATFHNSFISAKDIVDPMELYCKDQPPPPKNHSDALQHEYASSFKTAEIKEFITLLINKGPFSMVNNSELKYLEANNQVDPKVTAPALVWVYSYKFDANGHFLSFRARLAARGDLQHATDETCAATLAVQVFRAAIATSAAYGYKIRLHDIVAAYTNATLPRARIAYLPEKFRDHGSNLLIKKALYGLSESGLLWQKTLHTKITHFGLFPVLAVDCLFSNIFLTVLFYVDDFIAIHHERDIAKADLFGEMLMSTYETKPLGQINHFLGIRVVRDESLQKFC